MTARSGLVLATFSATMVYGRPHIATAAECAATPTQPARPPAPATEPDAPSTALRTAAETSTGTTALAAQPDAAASTTASADTSVASADTSVASASTATTGATQALAIGAVSCSGTCVSSSAFAEDHGYWAVNGTSTGLPAGTLVSLYYSYNNGAWARVRDARTTTTGTWSVSPPPVTSGGGCRWMATTGGSPTVTTSLRSRIISRTVAPRAAFIRATGTYASTAARMSLWGSVRPGVAGRTVTVQRYYSGAWHDVGSATTGTDRNYYWHTSLGTNTLASYTFRVRYLTQHHGWAAYSPAITLRRVLPADSVRLTDAQARGVLAYKGIPVASSGACSSRYSASCTALDTIRTATIRQALRVRDSGCPITVTGGTETGHATGTYSHWTGYKIDLAMTSGVSAYVGRVAASQGGPYWYSYPTRYFNEVSHWDLTVIE